MWRRSFFSKILGLSLATLLKMSCVTGIFENFIYIKERLFQRTSYNSSFRNMVLQKELVIVFTDEFLSIKNLFLFTYWCSKNLESIYFSKHLEIRNSSLEIFKDFVYSSRNLSYMACSYAFIDPIYRYQDPIDEIT